MGLFNLGKSKKEDTTKSLGEEIEAGRARVLNKLGACIVAFEKNPEGSADSEVNKHYNVVLDKFKLSYNAVKDITVCGDKIELSYLEQISQKADVISENMHNGVGVVYSDGTWHDGLKAKAVNEIYGIVWQWLHLE